MESVHLIQIGFVMNTKLLLLVVSASFVVTACRKDQYNTKPSLEIKEIQVRQVSTSQGNGTLIDIDIEVLDKEGDVKDSVFFQKLSVGTRPCPDNTILENLNFRIPEFPSSNQKVLFRLKFATVDLDGYTRLPDAQCPPRKDTSVFKMWVKDAGGNRSDTLVTPAIAIPL